MENSHGKKPWWRRYWVARLVALALIAASWRLIGRPLLLSPSPIGDLTLTWSEIWGPGARIALVALAATAACLVIGTFRLAAATLAITILVSGLTLNKLRTTRARQLQQAAEWALDDPQAAADLRRAVEGTIVLRDGKLLGVSLLGLNVLVYTMALFPRPHRHPVTRARNG